jgi:hypothetical protein
VLALKKSADPGGEISRELSFLDRYLTLCIFTATFRLKPLVAAAKSIPA